jgi:hypothetical protein
MVNLASAVTLLLLSSSASAFVGPSRPVTQTGFSTTVTRRFSSTKEDETKVVSAEREKIVNGATVADENEKPAMEIDPNAEGLPWWWELVWKLDIMKKGEPGKEIIFGDSANVLRTNIEQIYGGYPSLDGCRWNHVYWSSTVSTKI